MRKPNKTSGFIKLFDRDGKLLVKAPAKVSARVNNDGVFLVMEDTVVGKSHTTGHGCAMEISNGDFIGYCVDNVDVELEDGVEFRITAT